MSRQCEGCGASLRHARGRRKWCSERCRKETLYGGTCERCGGKTDGSRGRAKAPSICGDCLAERSAERRARIVAAWNGGEPTASIARREGVAPHAVTAMVEHERRVRGVPVLRRRRPARELWAKIERLYHRGYTYSRIADALGTTSGNISQMVQHMRDAGYDLPERNPAARMASWVAPVLELADQQPITVVDLRDHFGMSNSLARSRLLSLRKAELVERGPRRVVGIGPPPYSYTLSVRGRERLREHPQGD